MRKNLFILLAVAFTLSANILSAQNIFPSSGAAGLGTSTPDASSLLEIKSTTKGLLIPRMTKAQKNAIVSPATGLMIYQTNLGAGFYYYDGTQWSPVSSKGVNKTLSNLSSPTSVNVDLLPDSNNVRSLGSMNFPWKKINGMDIKSDGLNAALGVDALDSNQSVFNVAVGLSVLTNNTNGEYNTACGSAALPANTTGSYNTAIGSFVLQKNTTGEANTASGTYCLQQLSTGSYNTSYGISSLQNSTKASENTAVGDEALNLLVSGNYNVAVGSVAGRNTIGTQNTFVGTSAGRDNTNGNYNTAFGINAGYDGTAKTGSSNTYIGSYTDGPVNSANSSALGYNALITASNQVRIGNSSVTSIGGYASWSNVSDGRVKKNIKPNVPGLSFINKLQPVTYNLDLNAVDQITQRKAMIDKEGKSIQPSQTDMDARKAKEQIVYTGFIAQDVEKAAKSLNYDFSGVDAAKNERDLYGLRYSDFVVPLVKAVQELSSTNNALQSQITNMQAEIDELKAMIKNDPSASVSVTSSSLQQNAPNPYSQTTSVAYTLPEKFSSAAIVIFDNT